MRIKFILILFACLIGTVICDAANGIGGKNVTLVISPSANVRVKFGGQKLAEALKAEGYIVQISSAQNASSGNKIILGLLTDASVKKALTAGHVHLNKTPGKEGFAINSASNNNIIIAGADNSGVLYGCLELSERLKTAHQLPQKISIIDQPEMVLRGAMHEMKDRKKPLLDSIGLLNSLF